MNPLLIPPLIEAGRALIDRLFPDPVAQAAERSNAQMELLKLAQSGDLAQMEVNKVEAQHASIYVAGWRPGAGWVCVAGLGYSFLLQPLLPWIVASLGGSVEALPTIDTETLMVLLLGMLGLGGLRTAEKIKGVA